MNHLGLVLRYAAIFGILGFLAGFAGPLIVTPEANQGPLLGIFISGPLGVLFGAAAGLAVAYIRSRR